MRICGIIAEYNPFHRGHGLHIHKTRQLLGPDTAIVCCMSGSYVQRGGPALAEKHLRARWAVENGADLVLELPSPYALSSAEGFARGALSLLDALGCVTDLSFGSECGDTAALDRLAATLVEHDTVAATLLELRTGIPYAAARERALYQQVQEQAGLLRQPNDLLGVEYCKAIRWLGSPIVPHAILREGPGHDAPSPAQGLCSASWLRQRLQEGDWAACAPYLPPSVCRSLEELRCQGRGPLLEQNGQRAVLARLWTLSPEELARLPGAAEGLENRLWEAIRQGSTIEEICRMAKTKRYAFSRLRRMVWCAFLDLTAQEAAAPPAYLRVLAFSDRGRAVLSLARKQARLPLVTKPAHGRQLPPAARQAFEKEALRTRLSHLFAPDPGAYAPGEEWTQGPYYHRPEAPAPPYNK